jgi:hypothetical protein
VNAAALEGGTLIRWNARQIVWNVVDLCPWRGAGRSKGDVWECLIAANLYCLVVALRCVRIVSVAWVGLVGDRATCAVVRGTAQETAEPPAAVVCPRHAAGRPGGRRRRRLLGGHPLMGAHALGGCLAAGGSDNNLVVFTTEEAHDCCRGGGSVADKRSV